MFHTAKKYGKLLLLKYKKIFRNLLGLNYQRSGVTVNISMKIGLQKQTKKSNQSACGQILKNVIFWVQKIF